MPAVAFTKISGMYIVTQTSGAGKYYSVAATPTKFNALPAGNGVLITMGSDIYSVSLTDLTVNGQYPSTLSTALVLLNSYFGT